MGGKSRGRSAARKLSREKDKEIERRQNISEVQETEIELLKTMYPDDFAVLDDDIDYDFPRAFAIDVRARNSGSVRLILAIKIPREYPNDALRFSINNVKGLGLDDQKSLSSELHLIANSKLGEVCVFEIVTFCTDYLDDHGLPVPESFHAEMTNRRAQIEELEFQRQYEQKTKRESAEHSSFQRRVEEELSKKVARIEESKLVQISVPKLAKSRSPSLNANSSEVFAMDDIELESDDDAKEQDSCCLSPSWDSDSNHGDTVDSTNSASDDGRDDEQTDDELIAMSFNEVVGTPLQQFIASRPQRATLPPASLASSSVPKDLPSLGSISSSLRRSSRYLENFAELGVLGQGGFGSVVKARNVLDGIIFGIKKVPLPVGNMKARARILREVTTIARLHHRYIVRYYQSWIERSSGASKVSEDITVTTTPHTTRDSIHDWMSGAIHSPGSVALDEINSNSEQETLFIQFEYCPNKTLRAVIDEGGLTETAAWRIMRQLCEALHYIHQQGVVHRDIKPPNVFFDECGDIKIGDFGLAISKNVDIVLDGTLDKVRKNIGHSDCVGTPYYRSPEQEAGVDVSDKTDMYSLGITLFEMFTSFSTLMERHIALTALRKTGALDRSIELKCKRFVNEFRTIIQMLLCRDPSKRPSAETILRQCLIPLAEDEAQIQSALDSLSVPSSTFRSRVVETLFRVTPDRAIDVTFDLDPISNVNQGNLSSVLAPAAMKILSRIEQIFRRHAAVRYSTPILTPKLTIIKESNPIVLLDPFGILVQLPHSLTVPFARIVALRAVSSLRRFDISRVYRQAVAGGQPIQLLVTAFDIVFPSSVSRRLHVLYTCEILRILDDTLSILIGTSVRAVIYINDLRILEAILDQFVPSSKFPQARSAIESQFGRICDTAWPQIRRSLIQDYDLTEEAAAILDTYASLRGPSSTILPKFEAALNGHGLGTLPIVRTALESLQVIFRLSEQSGITHKIRFHAFVVADWQLYRGGLAFQVVHDASGANKSIAIGGRYDDLISRFRSPTSKSPQQSAVGMSIVLESLMPTVSQEPVLSSSVLLFCNMNKMLEERFRVASLLWSNGFQAEYDVDPSITLAALPRYCRVRSMRFLVVFRAAQYGSGMVKVFDIARHHQHGDRHAQGHPVELNNLVFYLQTISKKCGSALLEKDVSNDATSPTLPNTSTTTSGLSSALANRNQVEFLEDPDSSAPLRGHTRNQHIRTALTLSLPFVNGSDPNLYRIVCLSLPISAIRPCITAFYSGNVDMMRHQSSSTRHAWRQLLLSFCDWLQQVLDRNRLTIRYIVIYSIDDRKIDLLQL